MARKKGEIIVGHAAAAELVGVAVSTWQAYVSRGQAPTPDLPPTIEAGKARPTWRRRTILEWQRRRPGLGWRKGQREGVAK